MEKERDQDQDVLSEGEGRPYLEESRAGRPAGGSSAEAGSSGAGLEQVTETLRQLTASNRELIGAIQQWIASSEKEREAFYSLLQRSIQLQEQEAAREPRKEVPQKEAPQKGLPKSSPPVKRGRVTPQKSSSRAGSSVQVGTSIRSGTVTASAASRGVQGAHQISSPEKGRRGTLPTPPVSNRNMGTFLRSHRNDWGG
jgi:hypothetical protein